jgi:hypothetical protein
MGHPRDLPGPSTTRDEYSVGGAYRLYATLFLVASPYIFYRFFADLIYGSDGHQWATDVSAFRAHPLIVFILLVAPVVTVFIALLLIAFRFAIDLFFPRYMRGTFEDVQLKKTHWSGSRLVIRVSGRAVAALNDEGVAEVLLHASAPGRPIEMKLGGFNKVLHLKLG